MRSFKRLKARGFTLVELMIVVAIIGVLAALAIFGVRKYITAAKSAEVRNNIGAINRAAVAAYERDHTPAELLPGGGYSVEAPHQLCKSSIQVPNGFVPQGKKYQPVLTPGSDFYTGDAITGWKCLRFAINEPHIFAYKYTEGATFAVATNLAAPPGMSWAAEALGDLDGDGANFGNFAGVGAVENNFAKIATTLLESNTDN